MERVHTLIKDGKYPNCASIAKMFGISARAAERLIECMRVNYDVPIEYDRTRRGFYYTRAVEWFPMMPHMTQQEMFGLVVAQKAVGQYKGIPAEKPVRSAFEKLSWRLATSDAEELNVLRDAFSFRPFALEPVDEEVFATVDRALRERRVLELTYRNGGTSETKRRCFAPYHVACVDNRWYAIGYDRMRKAIRTFVLVRVTSPALLDDKFSVPEDFNPEDYLRGSLTTMQGTGEFHVVIELDRWATDFLGERKLHWSQQVKPIGSGARLTLRLNNLEEIERWVFGCVGHAVVVEPELLREQMTRTWSVIGKGLGVEERMETA